MRWEMASTVVGVGLVLAAASGCGSAGGSSPTSSSPTVSATAAQTPTPTALATPVPTPAPTPAPTLAATARQLTSVVQAVYPACHSSCIGGGTQYTTCESGYSPPFSTCPLTARLIARLEADIKSAGPSAADPLGGGQDPYWVTESLTANASVTGGVAHVVLGFGGRTPSRKDLVVVLSNGHLLVDDVYCTGQNPATTDAYTAGWMNRSTC